MNAKLILQRVEWRQEQLMNESISSRLFLPGMTSQNDCPNQTRRKFQNWGRSTEWWRDSPHWMFYDDDEEVLGSECMEKYHRTRMWLDSTADGRWREANTLYRSFREISFKSQRKKDLRFLTTSWSPVLSIPLIEEARLRKNTHC